MVIVDPPLAGLSSPLPRFAALYLHTLFRAQEEGLVALGYPREAVLPVLAQRGQYLVPPVEGRLLVDFEGGTYFVKALLLHHQFQVGTDLVPSLETGHPCAGEFGKAPSAGLALIAPRPLVGAETHVFFMGAVGTLSHLVVQYVPTGGVCGQVRAPEGLLDLLQQPLPLGDRQQKDFFLEFLCFHDLNIRIIAGLN